MEAKPTNEQEIAICLSCPRCEECVEVLLEDAATADLSLEEYLALTGDWTPSAELPPPDACPWAEQYRELEYYRLYFEKYRQNPIAQSKRLAYNRSYQKQHREHNRAYYHRRCREDPTYRPRLNAKNRARRARQKGIVQEADW